MEAEWRLHRTAKLVRFEELFTSNHHFWNFTCFMSH